MIVRDEGASGLGMVVRMVSQGLPFARGIAHSTAVPAAPSTPSRGQAWTVGELLAWTTERFSKAGIEEARVDAQHLLAHALGCTRMELYLRHDALIGEAERAPLRELVRRRLSREPVAYIVGRRGFHALDLELAVDGRVLVPRPETEHLVDWALELLPSPGDGLTVVDVGTGSGAIALAIARARPAARVIAVDRSEDALAVARANADRLGAAIECVRSDLLEGLTPPAGGFDAVLANLPYIPTQELAGLDPEVREFEPHAALDGGADGLRLIVRLIDACAAPGVLGGAGRLFLEVGAGQAPAVLAALEGRGYRECAIRRDYAQIERVVAGLSPG
jgi:release factor glutamine methyltransferase